MKFLADMGLAGSTVSFLRAQGHDAIHLRDQQLQRLADEGIITKAQAEDRIILTHDLDFGRIIALTQAAKPSVITFRLNDMRSIQVNGYLAQVLAHFSQQLVAEALVSVNERGIRVRSLPIHR